MLHTEEVRPSRGHMVAPAVRHRSWEADGDTCAVPFRARLASIDGERSLRVAGWLTPYDAETIGMLALRMGPGTRLEFTLAPRASERSLGWVWEEFSYLDARGIEVSVERARVGGTV